MGSRCVLQAALRPKQIARRTDSAPAPASGAAKEGATEACYFGYQFNKSTQRTPLAWLASTSCGARVTRAADPVTSMSARAAQAMIFFMTIPLKEQDGSWSIRGAKNRRNGVITATLLRFLERRAGNVVWSAASSACGTFQKHVG
jgi:hypothetical protein